MRLQKFNCFTYCQKKIKFRMTSKAKKDIIFLLCNVGFFFFRITKTAFEINV